MPMPFFGHMPFAGGASGEPSDPNLSSVKLLLGVNGVDAATATSDESPAAHGAATFVGNAQLDTAQFKFGTSSLLLDGNGDYIDFSDSADWRFGLGQFTVECWVRFNSVSGYQSFMGRWHVVGIREWMFSSTGSNQLAFVYSTSGSGVTDTITGSWTPSTNTWYHVAADRDASGTIRLYADGVMRGSGAGNETFAPGGGPMRIGSVADGSFPNYLNGWLDEVRITKGVARYASDGGYTVPTSAFPRS